LITNHAATARKQKTNSIGAVLPFIIAVIIFAALVVAIAR